MNSQTIINTGWDLTNTLVQHLTGKPMTPHKYPAGRHGSPNNGTGTAPMIKNNTTTKSDTDLLEPDEIKLKYFVNGVRKIANAATIITRPYSRSLGIKIDYWIMFEFWYKEIENMMKTHDDFEPEDWARNYVVKLIRDNQWVKLKDVKFEAITKKSAVTDYYGY